jgi:two-component system sensor histidine kinase/response regulator
MKHFLSEKPDEIHASILIVDDRAENLQVLGKILDEHEIEFRYASSGQEALEAVSYTRPDLILLDVNMPEMNGYEVCEVLKKDPDTSYIPVIFLTVKDEPEDIIRGFTAGGIDYISKPFNSRELITRVNSHLELSLSKQIMAYQNKKLSRLNRQLKDTVASRNKFFSIIAHDLKDPFNTLIGFSDILLKSIETASPEEIREIVKHIYESSVFGFELLTNLLEWSSSQTGRIKYNPEKVEVRALATRIVDLLKSTAEKKQISLNVPVVTEHVVMADRKMIETVLRNLVSNAIKFTSANGSVTIQYGRIDNSTVKISVKDTGMGIPEEDINKLFRVEETFSTPGTELERGTGLGLLLCKEFVEKNCGEIVVESEVGVGSEFTITLPTSI